MKKTQLENAVQLFSGVARKVVESAMHAAVFAFVSKKVTSYMTKQEDKVKDSNKVRVDDDSDGTKTGG